MVETQNFMCLNVLTNLKPALRIYSPAGGEKGGGGGGGNVNQPFVLRSGEGTDLGFCTLSLRAVDERNSDEIWYTAESFTEPEKLWKVSLADMVKPTFALGPHLKSCPEQFDGTNLQCEQRWATSDDGTEVPYFLIGKNVTALLNSGGSGNNPLPTLLYGYGGFEISMTPAYMAVSGFQWMQQGGLFVIANIRGGGEFGPSWHQAALKEKRHKAYEDFEAVGRDLVGKHKLTIPKKLGAMGGSNGGLLMGNMFARRATASGNLFG